MSLRVDSNRPKPKLEPTQTTASASAETAKAHGAKEGGLLEEVAHAVGKVVGGVLDALTSFAGDAKAQNSSGASAKPKTSKASKESFLGKKPASKSEASGSSSPTSGVGSQTHKLAAGETLSKVAKQHNVTLDALRKANPQLAGKDDKKLPVGLELKIPAPKNGASSSAAKDPVKRPAKSTSSADSAKSSSTATHAASGTPKPAGVAPKPVGNGSGGSEKTGSTTSNSSAAPSPKPAEPKAAQAPKPEAAAPKPTPSAGGNGLGSLSAKYESGGTGDPGAVSPGDAGGGVSYGTHQFSSKTGTAQDFVDSLKDTHPDYHKALQGKTPGTEEFGKAWKALAAKDSVGFGAAQKEFVDRTHYDSVKEKVEKAVPGLNVDSRSQAVREALYSTAVQHRNNSVNVFKKALTGQDVSNMSDADIVKAVYAERGKKNADGELGYFSKGIGPSAKRHRGTIQERTEGCAGHAGQGARRRGTLTTESRRDRMRWPCLPRRGAAALKHESRKRSSTSAAPPDRRCGGSACMALCRGFATEPVGYLGR